MAETSVLLNQNTGAAAIGIASANSLESDLGCTSRIDFDNVTLTYHYFMLTSQKPCQYNNKFDCSETNGYNIPQDAINEVKVFSIKYRYSDNFIEKTLASFILGRGIKFMGGGGIMFSHLYKNEQEGFFPGGYCPFKYSKN